MGDGAAIGGGHPPGSTNVSEETSARHVGTWQRTAIRVVVAATVCWLCIAGFTVFVFGS